MRLFICMPCTAATGPTFCALVQHIPPPTNPDDYVIPGPRHVCISLPGHAVEQLVRGAGAAAARVPVRRGRVDAAVGRAQPAARRAPAARPGAGQAAGQPALLPGETARSRNTLNIYLF